jgi:hypothetical protein
MKNKIILPARKNSDNPITIARTIPPISPFHNTRTPIFVLQTMSQRKLERERNGKEGKNKEIHKWKENSKTKLSDIVQQQSRSRSRESGTLLE